MQVDNDGGRDDADITTGSTHVEGASHSQGGTISPEDEPNNYNTDTATTQRDPGETQDISNLRSTEGSAENPRGSAHRQWTAHG